MEVLVGLEELSCGIPEHMEEIAVLSFRTLLTIKQSCKGEGDNDHHMFTAIHNTVILHLHIIQSNVIK